MATRTLLRAAALAAALPLLLAAPAHASIITDTLNNLDAANNANLLGIKSGVTNTNASDQGNSNHHARP
ncbi:hypothetical protein AB0F71_38255 [Kitasatospora sp. NPDC028055]|uniref:hypothetical protein n=1 Tax=Kitasatospora sp. NPDC028055 TaxID=3155653 RepID=UPI0033FDD432